jgi:hypothetical protein
MTTRGPRATPSGPWRCSNAIDPQDRGVTPSFTAAVAIDGRPASFTH